MKPTSSFDPVCSPPDWRWVLPPLSAAPPPSPATGPIDAKSREIFAKVISIPTQLGNAKVPEMAAYLAGEFRAAGFPAEDITITPFKLPDNDTATLVVRYRGDGTGGKPIVLLAHMDVVTAKRADWERDPYTLVEENGFFYGRGTCGQQGTAWSMIASLFLRLKAEKYVPKRDLILYFSGDEETSQETTQRMAREHRALIDAEYALNSDSGGGNLDDETGKPTDLRDPGGREDLRRLHAHHAQPRRPQLGAARRQRHLRPRDGTAQGGRIPVSGHVERHHHRELPRKRQDPRPVRWARP